MYYVLLWDNIPTIGLIYYYYYFIIIITSNLFTRSKSQPYRRIRGAV